VRTTQGTSCEPNGIAYSELIFQFLWLFNAWIGIVPFAWRQTTQYEEAQGHAHKGEAQEPPNLLGERIHEGKELRSGFLGLQVENCNA